MVGVAASACGGARLELEPPAERDVGAAPPRDASAPTGFGSDAGGAPVDAGPIDRCAFPSFTDVGPSDAALDVRVLYTWRRGAHVLDIRREQELYLVEADAHGRRGHLFDLLAARRRAGDEVAALLDSPRFAKGVFAWTHPWATTLSDEDYGANLVRVELGASTYVVHVTSASGAYAATTVAGAPVPLDVVLDAPDRIGAVYFVNDAPRDVTCVRSTFQGTFVYREVYLAQPSTRVSFELDTPRVVARLERDLSVLQSLRDEVATWPLCAPTRPDLTLDVWARGPADDDYERYLSCCAFARCQSVGSAWLDGGIRTLESSLKLGRDPLVVGPA